MIKTKQEVVSIQGSIWALPSHNVKPGEFPFHYELQSGEHHWNGSAIMVTKVTLSAVVPEGVDLYEMDMETLTHRENEAMRVYSEAMTNISNIRKSMLLLNAPTPAPIDGEYIPAPVISKTGDDDIPF
jgi:hypothetical protein